jgi:hypothetical protein
MIESSVSDLDLLELQVRALFTHDSNGRIVAINEPGGGQAPPFFFGRTAAGNLWRVRHDIPTSLAGALVDLAAREPVTNELDALPVGLGEIKAALAEHGLQVTVSGGPAYRFPSVIRDLGGVTPITADNLHLLGQMEAYRLDVEAGLAEYEPRLAVVVDGAAVAICNSARLTDRVAEAGVDTVEAYRGRGYAPVVVAAWAREIRESGRIPLYSTSWENHASQAVARKLGLVAYGADLSLVEVDSASS